MCRLKIYDHMYMYAYMYIYVSEQERIVRCFQSIHFYFLLFILIAPKHNPKYIHTHTHTKSMYACISLSMHEFYNTRSGKSTFSSSFLWYNYTIWVHSDRIISFRANCILVYLMYVITLKYFRPILSLIPQTFWAWSLVP